MSKSLAELQAEFDANLRKIRGAAHPPVPRPGDMPDVLKDLFKGFDKKPPSGSVAR